MTSSVVTYSKLCERLDGSEDGAWSVHNEALELQRSGEDVVVLSIGDPDFRTPEPIVDNAVSHLKVGRTHYSPALGELSLRRAVADYETRVSPHDCSVDEVSIFPGVTAGIHAVMSCLLDPGDGAVVVDPMYVGYEPIFNALQAEVQIAQADSRNGFIIEVEAITNAVKPNTKVVFINTPANPTGAIIPREDLASLAEYCQSRGIWLVCDEVYSMFTFEKPHISLRTAAKKLDQLVVIDGLSKSHAMSGWRIGWVVAPPTLTRYIGNFSAMSIFGCPQFIQDASAFALNNDEYYVKEMRDEYQKRRNAVCERLLKMPGIRFNKPDAGMFIMIDITSYCAEDQLFAKQLLDGERVSLLPGSAFGDSTAGHVRFSLVQPTSVLTEGCDRLETFLKNYPHEGSGGEQSVSSRR